MTSTPERTAAGVVVHLDEAEPGKHESVLRNIANLIDELGPETPVELVTHGPGVSATLADAPHAGQLAKLLGRGLSVTACGNTLRATGVDEAQLLPGVTVVPAGVAQLVRRQRQGWAYLRP